MCLGAHAVVFVFDGCIFEIAQRIFRGFGWAGQHETQGVEQAHAGFVQFALQRPALTCRLYRPSNMLARCTSDQSCAVGFGDGLFYQAFFQADAQVTGDDFYDVFGFQRRGAGK